MTTNTTPRVGDNLPDSATRVDGKPDRFRIPPDNPNGRSRVVTAKVLKWGGPLVIVEVAP